MTSSIFVRREMSFCTWGVICDVWCVMCDVRCVMCDVWCVMCDVRLWVRDLWRDGWPFTRFISIYTVMENIQGGTLYNLCEISNSKPLLIYMIFQPQPPKISKPKPLAAIPNSFSGKRIVSLNSSQAPMAPPLCLNERVVFTIASQVMRDVWKCAICDVMCEEWCVMWGVWCLFRLRSSAYWNF